MVVRAPGGVVHVLFSSPKFRDVVLHFVRSSADVGRSTETKDLVPPHVPGPDFKYPRKWDLTL